MKLVDRVLGALCSLAIAGITFAEALEFTLKYLDSNAYHHAVFAGGFAACFFYLVLTYARDAK